MHAKSTNTHNIIGFPTKSLRRKYSLSTNRIRTDLTFILYTCITSDKKFQVLTYIYYKSNCKNRRLIVACKNRNNREKYIKTGLIYLTRKKKNFLFFSLILSIGIFIPYWMKNLFMHRKEYELLATILMNKDKSNKHTHNNLALCAKTAKVLQGRCLLML
jgi:hypothetical protein